MYYPNSSLSTTALAWPAFMEAAADSRGLLLHQKAKLKCHSYMKDQASHIIKTAIYFEASETEKEQQGLLSAQRLMWELFDMYINLLLGLKFTVRSMRRLIRHRAYFNCLCR